VLLTPPTQKSAVLCTQPPAGEHHTKKADDARQPNKASKTTHTPKRHATPAPATPPHHTLTCCAPHAHPLLPTAMAFVPYGFVLVQVQVFQKNTSIYGLWVVPVRCCVKAHLLTFDANPGLCHVLAWLTAITCPLLAQHVLDPRGGFLGFSFFVYRAVFWRSRYVRGVAARRFPPQASPS
jgi:hypothetical protein